MTSEEILSLMEANRNSKNKSGMARFGINTEKAFGLSIPFLRNIAKQTGKNQELSLKLWETGYHEARILASMAGEPDKVTPEQMDDWAACFNSWDLCDQCCNNLFVKTVHSYNKAFEWINDEREFVRRAGFVLMAVLAVHSRDLSDGDFLRFLELVEKGSGDGRNFVKKAVNWALRQIGKRNIFLREQAIELSEKLAASDGKTARWIGKDALKELTNKKIKVRLNNH